MRTVLLSCACLAVASAHASFELGIVYTSSGFNRVDTVSGAYFGTFGGESSYGTGFSLDPSQPGTLVESFSYNSQIGYRRWDYSNGTLLDTRQTSYNGTAIGVTALASGNLVFQQASGGVYSASVRTASLSLVRTLGFTSGTTNLLDIVETSTGNLIALTRRAGTTVGTYRFDLNVFTSTGTIATNTVSIVDNAPSSYFNSLDFQGSTLLVGGSTSVDSDLYSVSGTTLNLASGTVGFLKDTGGAAFGHGGRYYGFGFHASTDMTLTTADLGGNYWSIGRVIANMPKATVKDFDVVVAPEPGSILAIGIGLVCVARRRKHRNS